MSGGGAHTIVVLLADAGALAESDLAPFAGWLDDSERPRLARFVRPERRRQFLAGRVLARRALGEVLSLAPAEVRLAERPGGAPVLVFPGVDAGGFSISHSGRWVACAASASCRVGLDIEIIDPARDIDALAAQAFDAPTQARLVARPAHARVRDFYAMWTWHEARFKLHGELVSSFDLSRPDLAIALCCAEKLDTAPVVRIVTLY